MTILLVQTFLLLLGAFLLGASLACLFRRAVSGRRTVEEPALSPGLAAAAAAAPVVAAGDADRFGRALTGGHEAASALQPTGPVVEVQPRPPVRVSPLIEPVEAASAPVVVEPEPESQPEPLPPEPVAEVAPDPVYEAAPEVAPEPEPEPEHPAGESYTQVALAVAAGAAAAAAARAIENARSEEASVEDSAADEPESDERVSDEPEAHADETSYAEIAAATAAAAAAENATAEDGANDESAEDTHTEEAVEDDHATDASASPDDNAGRSYTEVAVGAASGLAAAAVAAAIADEDEGELEASDETGDTADGADITESASPEFDTPEAGAVAPLPADAPAGDDFTRIHTIDTTLRDRLHNLGMTRFADVGGWSASDVMRFSQALGVVPGRIEQENWVGQAQILAGGGVTDYPRWRGSEDASRAAAPADSERLNRIIGIDPESEGVLRDNGVASLADIAAWNDDDVALFEDVLGTPGRIGRENWVEQARFLTRGSGVAGAIESIGGAAAGAVAAATAAVVAAVASDETPPADEEHDAVEEQDAPVEHEPPAEEASLAEPVDFEGSDDVDPEASSGASASGARGEGYAGLRSVRSEALVGGGGYALPPVGGVDDLKRIRGIGLLIEKKLHSLGITSYEQVANWTGEDIDRISQLLDFKGRIERENWIEQARILASGGQTEFSRRVDRGEA